MKSRTNLLCRTLSLSCFCQFSLPHSENVPMEPPPDDGNLPTESACPASGGSMADPVVFTSSDRACPTYASDGSAGSSRDGGADSTITNISESSGEDDLLDKLESRVIIDIEEAAICLQKITETRKDARISLCDDRLLSALRPLIVSAYTSIQASSLATLVNLSTEKVNRVKILQSRIVPNLTFLLERGSLDVQELAARAMLNLSLEDGSTLEIGHLGALPRLVGMLHSKSEHASSDSATALYHLSLQEANCTKLIQAGSVHVIMDVLRSSRHFVETLLLVVSNLGCWPMDGPRWLLDGGKMKSESEWFNCLNALLALSCEGDRFRLLAMAYGANKILGKVEMKGPRRMARSLVDIIYARSVR
ncbi:hypothetical protein SAY86_030863 [Trapa natans]|uniref:Uncharacterized protein n=1 Tax=Trapa natans TaxID=22666 RepID=A0AAN7M5P4_TRANT|nr:hypothetical protein SAY86_030863 [Trapa natans]